MKHHLKAISDINDFKIVQKYHWTQKKALEILQSNAPDEFVQLTKRRTLEIELYIPNKIR
ncbi:MAG: hypothetical protein ACI94Y_004289 [Maribacter sp.]|jgi:hypothetical protein